MSGQNVPSCSSVRSSKFTVPSGLGTSDSNPVGVTHIPPPEPPPIISEFVLFITVPSDKTTSLPELKSINCRGSNKTLGSSLSGSGFTHVQPSESLASSSASASGSTCVSSKLPSTPRRSINSSGVYSLVAASPSKPKELTSSIKVLVAGSYVTNTPKSCAAGESL